MNIHVTLTLPVLSKGSPEPGTVARLQEMLNVFVGHGEEHSGIHPLKIDGVFGDATEQKVKAFQKFTEGAPLAVDGKVGQATWTKLLTMWLSGNAPG
jgi:peptidoglycan hydrolase-like protein with peptidoglycan-binding domain